MSKTIEQMLAERGIVCASEHIHADRSIARLIEAAIESGDATLTSTGSIAVFTGERTGRSPHDRYIVDTPNVHDRIAWGKVNEPMSPENYDALFNAVAGYLSGRELYITRGLAGANRTHSRKFMVVCEKPSQALFAKQILVRPTPEELDVYGEPDFVVLAAPEYHCSTVACGTRSDVAVAINFERREIVICGTGYCGEIKKSIFSTMNYLLPVEDGVLPMHSSANMGYGNGDVAVFFGLSGTGKTTLSADPGRLLIGDDEHGWGDEGVFNIEGGCYAKCIDLSPKNEPEIFKAIRFGSISENVVLDPRTHEADYTDRTLTENTRCAYPVEFIGNSLTAGTAGPPSVIIFLTCDAFGVLPPIARLSREAAMYHFMTGFTAKVAGTEEGVTDPEPTFSALFGEPFMPLDPLEYADMLSKRMEQTNTRAYLVNTGWTGGPYGVGERFALPITRALITATLVGSIEEAEFVHDERFRFDVPTSCPGVNPIVLDPRLSWTDKQAYDAQADKLARMFADNFATRFPNAPEELIAAGPHPLR